MTSKSTPSMAAPHEVVSGPGWPNGCGAEQEDVGLSLIKRPLVKAPFPHLWLSPSVIPQDF